MTLNQEHKIMAKCRTTNTLEYKKDNDCLRVVDRQPGGQYIGGFECTCGKEFEKRNFAKDHLKKIQQAREETGLWS